MSFNSSEILFFTEYTFTDTGDTAPHFGLVIVPPKLTDFKHSILCAVITSRRPHNPYAVHILEENNYTCFRVDSYVRLRDLDYVPINGLDERKEQPLDKLTPRDAKMAFKKLRNVLFSSNPPVDKYLRAVIIREWKKVTSATSQK